MNEGMLPHRFRRLVAIVACPGRDSALRGSHRRKLFRIRKRQCPRLTRILNQIFRYNFRFRLIATNKWQAVEIVLADRDGSFGGFSGELRLVAVADDLVVP